MSPRLLGRAPGVIAPQDVGRLESLARRMADDSRLSAILYRKPERLKCRSFDLRASMAAAVRPPRKAGRQYDAADAVVMVRRPRSRQARSARAGISDSFPYVTDASGAQRWAKGRCAAVPLWRSAHWPMPFTATLKTAGLGREGCRAGSSAFTRGHHPPGAGEERYAME